MRPIRDLTEAVTMPFKAIFVVGLCWLINAWTFTGYWWVQWVALGMGIATVVALGRGLRTAVVLGLLYWAGRAVYRRYGEAAKARFDEWAAGKEPSVQDIMQAMRHPPQPADGSPPQALARH